MREELDHQPFSFLLHLLDGTQYNLKETIS